MNRIRRKAKLVLTLAVSAVTTFALGQTCSNRQSKVDFKDETKLEVDKSPYRIGVDTMNRMKRVMKRGIKWPNRNLADSTRIEMSSLDSLYQLAEQYLKNLCSKEECVTGVWIYLGLEKEKMTYYFQPGVLRKKKNSDPQRHLFDTALFAAIYAFNGSTFESVGAERFGNGIASYRTRMRVRHHRSSPFFSDGYFDRTTYMGDTQKVFYTFQEIYTYYHDRVPEQGTYYCDNIYLHNAGAYFDLTSSSGPYKRKHVVYLTTKPDSTKALVALSGQGADLAHVCPSVCSELDYPTEQQLLEYNSKTKKKRR